MFDIVNDIGDRFIKVIGKDMKTSDVLEMKVLAAKYTSDVIGSVAFGLDCQCKIGTIQNIQILNISFISIGLEDPDSEFMKNGRKIFDLSAFVLLKFFFASGFPELCRKLNVTSFPQAPMDFFHKAFIDTLNYREKNDIKRNDFVSMLLGLKEFFTPDELAAESFLVYIGGFETSSTLLNFTMYELALNPDVQEKLRSEIRSATFETGGKLTYELLTEMKYLDMVINESLRKYPPIPSKLLTNSKKQNSQSLSISQACLENAQKITKFQEQNSRSRKERCLRFRSSHFNVIQNIFPNPINSILRDSRQKMSKLAFRSPSFHLAKDQET